jgi:hypothetical protein
MWDRYDDAMDDIQESETDYEKERDELVAKLTARGEVVEPWQPPKPEPVPEGNYMGASHRNATSKLDSLREYVLALRARVAKLG